MGMIRKIKRNKARAKMEIDKLNGTYIINGENVRAGIEKYL